VGKGKRDAAHAATPPPSQPPAPAAANAAQEAQPTTRERGEGTRAANHELSPPPPPPPPPQIRTAQADARRVAARLWVERHVVEPARAVLQQRGGHGQRAPQPLPEQRARARPALPQLQAARHKAGHDDDGVARAGAPRAQRLADAQRLAVGLVVVAPEALRDLRQGDVEPAQDRRLVDGRLDRRLEAPLRRRHGGAAHGAVAVARRGQHGAQEQDGDARDGRAPAVSGHVGARGLERRLEADARRRAAHQAAGARVFGGVGGGGTGAIVGGGGGRGTIGGGGGGGGGGRCAILVVVVIVAVFGAAAAGASVLDRGLLCDGGRHLEETPDVGRFLLEDLLLVHRSKRDLQKG